MPLVLLRIECAYVSLVINSFMTLEGEIDAYINNYNVDNLLLMSIHVKVGK